MREAKAPLHDLEGAMDAVLIDAPCTGTGVWRRRPDSKWKLTERALENRVGEQRALLADAAAYVRSGGWLIYVTCSLLPEENEDQVAAFLSGRADFATVPPARSDRGGQAAGEPRGRGVCRPGRPDADAAPHGHGRILHCGDEARVSGVRILGGRQ